MSHFSPFTILPLALSLCELGIITDLIFLIKFKKYFKKIWLENCGASGRESACQSRRHKSLKFDPWVRNIPWRRKWQPIQVFLPGKLHAQRTLEGYGPWGCKRISHNWTTENTYTTHFKPPCHSTNTQGHPSAKASALALPSAWNTFHQISKSLLFLPTSGLCSNVIFSMSPLPHWLLYLILHTPSSQICRWHHPYGRKWRPKETLENERGEWKSWLTAQHSEN